MSNTEQSVEISHKEDKEDDILITNENQETIIDIDEATINSTLSEKPVDIREKSEHQNEKNKTQEVSYAIENEKQSAKMGNNQRKPPKIWVHFLKEAKNSPGKQIEVGRQEASDGRNYQYGQDAGGGGGLDYDPRSRNGFLQIVFAILMVMLVVTAMYVMFVLSTPELEDYYRKHRKMIYFLSLAVLLATSYVFMCCMPIVRSTPCNIIILLIVVAATSNLVAALSCVIRSQIIFISLIATSVTVGICLLLALSSFDFTAWYLYIVVIGCVLMLITVVLIILKNLFHIYYKPVHLALLYICTIFHIIVLIMELQMVLGGKSIELNEDEYVIAAYMLYSSIVNIFLHILSIIADLDRSL